MNRIKELFSSWGDRMQSWLYGRYGYDELNRFLNMFALVLVLVSVWLTTVLPSASHAVSGVALAVYLISVYRTYSRNIVKRRQERDTYLRLTEPFRASWRLKKNKFADRKTHRYFKCKECKTVLRVPKGKGKISIHCRSCGAEMIKKT